MTILLIFSINAIAENFRVLVRSENNKPYFEEMRLDDLTSTDSFEGKHFKIVQGKSDEAIKFTADEELKLKAATVYFHLTRARDFFINELSSDYVQNMGQITIRLDLTNNFADLGHFAHDEQDPQYNNALTIPAGKGYPKKGISPWGAEIWFRPSKSVHISELKVNNLSNQNVKGVLKKFRNQTHMQNLQRFLAENLLVATQDVNINPLSTDNLIRTAGSSVILELAYQNFDPLNRALSPKWYSLESSMVPEIIYHEFAHMAFSDKLVLSHSTPIIEGMADYFAGRIAHSPTLAMDIKRYNTFNGKDALKKQLYKIQFEQNQYANTDFVFGLLWSMNDLLGDQEGLNFVYELRNYLSTNSSIRTELVEGMLKTCQVKCTHPFTDKLSILKSLDSKGL